MPKIEVEYYHRVGRTGRFRSKGVAISFVREQESSFTLGKDVKLIELLEEMPDIPTLNMYLKAVMDEDKDKSKITFEINQSYDYQKEKGFTKKFDSESKISEWTTNMEHTFYNNTEFQYLDPSLADEVIVSALMMTSNKRKCIESKPKEKPKVKESNQMSEITDYEVFSKRAAELMECKNCRSIILGLIKSVE